MTKNNLAGLSAMVLMGAIQPYDNPYKNSFDDLIDDMNGINVPQKREPKPIHQNMSERDQSIKNGLKEFNYSGNSVFALNQKNADKKARKLGYID